MGMRYDRQSRDSQGDASTDPVGILREFRGERSASVVVPCFQCETTIDRTMESLCRQSGGRSYEVIAVDNGSTDGTRNRLESWFERFPSLVRIVHEPRPGSYAARNAGVAAARGEILAFLDADAVAASGWLDHLSAALAIEGVVATGTEVEAAPDQRSLVARHSKLMGLLEQRATMRHPRAPFLQTVSLAVRRADFHAIGGFDESLFSGGDADFCWRLQQRFPARRLHLVPEALVEHHHRTTVRGLWSQFRRYGEGDVILDRKHGQRPGHFWSKSALDTIRVLVSPILGLAGLIQAAARKDPVFIVSPWLRIIQILARRRGQWGVRAGHSAPRHRA